MRGSAPRSRMLATPATVDDIEASGAATLSFYRDTFMNGALRDGLATGVVVLERHPGKTLKVGSAQFEIPSFVDAEAQNGTVLWQPDSKSLITGDIAYHAVHLWLKDTAPKGWLAALDTLDGLGAKHVYPGHGEQGGASIATREPSSQESVLARASSGCIRAQ